MEPESKWIVVAAVPFVVLCLSRLDYFPLWDSLQYYGCALEGSRRSLNPLQFNCFSHPTLAYFWPIGILQRLAYGRYAWVIAFNVGLGCVALALYAELAALAMSGPHRWFERMLAVAILACCPVFVASAIQLNPDYAVTISFLGVVLSLARERLGAAVAWGLLATFCKETGAPLFCVAAAAYVAVFLGTTSLPFNETCRWLARRSVLAVVPAVALGTAAIVYIRQGAAGFWIEQSGVGSAALFSTTSGLDPQLVAVLTAIFILNFMWLPSIALIMGALTRSARFFMRRPSRGHTAPESRDRFGVFLGVLLAGTVVLMVLPRTFSNVRYHLVIYPLVFLLFTRVLVRDVSSVKARVSVMFTLMVLFLAANLRSIDPVSTAIYKTFAFGRERLYAMTSISHECCGLGRDQLAYSLEFTQFHYLLNAVLADTLRDPATPLAMHALGNWHLIEAVDRRTLRRAAPSETTFNPVVLTFDAVQKLAIRPGRVFYIELPNMDDHQELQQWATLYRVGSQKAYNRGGYALQVRELVLE